MADIAPLTPLRYASHIPLADVVAPPYDVIDDAQRKALADRHEDNVVRLILPEGEGDTKYENARALLHRWREAGVLVRDPEPAFYRYDQTFSVAGGGRVRRRGFLGLVRVGPYEEGNVLPHERTLSGPKEDRLKLFRATQTNLSPGFMLYRDPALRLSAPLDHANVISEFRTADGIDHALAKIVDPEAMREIVRVVAESALLIADGHHRYETSLRYRNEVNAEPFWAEPRFFLVFLTNGDDPDLRVFPTHRLVHSVPAFSFEKVLTEAAPLFEVERLPPGAPVPTLPTGRPAFAAFDAQGAGAILTLRSDANLSTHPILGARPEVLRRTDVAILHDALLEQVLGITRDAQAKKTNLRYPQDATAALAEVRGGGGQALFVMNPTPVQVVREVAEAGEVMPQKSTFFYPKVLTGLLLHTLDPNRTVPQAG